MGANNVVQHPSAPQPRGTTNLTIVADLKASILARAGMPAGATWGEFKEAMRHLGIADDMPLASIEYGVSQFGNGRLVLDTEPDGVVIREGRV